MTKKRCKNKHLSSTDRTHSSSINSFPIFLSKSQSIHPSINPLSKSHSRCNDLHHSLNTTAHNRQQLSSIWSHTTKSSNDSQWDQRRHTPSMMSSSMNSKQALHCVIQIKNTSQRKHCFRKKRTRKISSYLFDALFDCWMSPWKRETHEKY